MSSFDQEIEVEQVAVTRIYHQFDKIFEQVRQKLNIIRQDGFGSTFAARLERDSFATFYEDSIEMMRTAEDKLVFGKLNYNKDKHPQITNEEYYIGRSGIFDNDHNPLLIDWRSSIGGDFYAATPQNPRQVRRRRHILTTNREVVGLEDEIMTDEQQDVDDLAIIGEGALLQAMRRKRTKYMQDIVSTIQQEQDAIIRMPLEGVHVIQGGPGTGKTAVALHRIAYLLYNYQDQLGTNGVLFVGPSLRFIEYVARVLPSLGESGVHQTTILGLLEDDDIKIGRQADVHETALKGCKRMVKVIRRAVKSFINKLDQPLEFHISGEVLQLTPEIVERAQSEATHSRQPHNLARKVFVNNVLEVMIANWASHQNQLNTSEITVEDIASGVQSSRSETSIEIEELRKDVRVDKQLAETLNLLWMPIDPKQLVERLFSNLKRLEYCTKGLYTKDELSYLHHLVKHVDANGNYLLSSADIGLIDEITVLVGKMPKKAKGPVLKDEDDSLTQEQRIEYMNEVLREVARDAQGIVTPEMLANRFDSRSNDKPEIRKYRHIVIDEAQELSYMEYRMLRRRSSTLSFTIVGDVNQKASPAGVAKWEELSELLGEVAVKYLTVNYRNSQEIAEYAYQEAVKRHLEVPLTKSPRDVVGSVEVVKSKSAQETVKLAIQYANELAHLGRTAVITQAPEQIPNSTHYDTMTAVESKGLEYDSVIIVNPEEIGSAINGNSNLYVSITRATSKLVVIEE